MAPTDEPGADPQAPEEHDAITNWYGEETATFGDRLTGARETAAISQRDLAQRIGIKTATLRKWEDDLAEPRANRLSMLAGMLGVSLSWLLTGRGEGPEAPAGELPQTTEVTALLNEMRTIRGQMDAQTAKLATLEKRLRRALSQMP